jgi:hypothetical protein
VIQGEARRDGSDQEFVGEAVGLTLHLGSYAEDPIPLDEGPLPDPAGFGLLDLGPKPILSGGLSVAGAVPPAVIVLSAQPPAEGREIALFARSHA